LEKKIGRSLPKRTSGKKRGRTVAVPNIREKKKRDPKRSSCTKKKKDSPKKRGEVLLRHKEKGVAGAIRKHEKKKKEGKTGWPPLRSGH